MATGAFGSDLELLELHQENRENSNGERGIGKSIANSLLDGFSPCPWNDYLKCVSQSPESVNKLLKEAKIFMKGTRDIENNQAGGYHRGGYSINSFISQLRTTDELSRSVETEVDKAYEGLQTERMKAAAAVAYISRLFALGKEDDVDQLRDYYRKSPHKMELDDVMYKLMTYIKNTRKDVD